MSLSENSNQTASELWALNTSILSNTTDVPSFDPPATTLTIAILSSLFFAIGLVGIAGNLLVIFVILSDRKMRQSVINVLIMNLAVSDLIIMVVCIPEIVQFMLNTGWRLGLVCCCIVRFTQVFSLYASVMTLVAICVESLKASKTITSHKRMRWLRTPISPVTAQGLIRPGLSCFSGYRVFSNALCDLSKRKLKTCTNKLLSFIFSAESAF
uniref:G-protein coupled receptors family 1 profile domain-containing protein n=1 Tax=Strigamia maritima TaxID=126957 RepID=T1IUC2_STRMM